MVNSTPYFNKILKIKPLFLWLPFKVTESFPLVPKILCTEYLFVYLITVVKYMVTVGPTVYTQIWQKTKLFTTPVGQLSYTATSDYAGKATASRAGRLRLVYGKRGLLCRPTGQRKAADYYPQNCYHMCITRSDGSTQS